MLNYRFVFFFFIKLLSNFLYSAERKSTRNELHIEGKIVVVYSYQKKKVFFFVLSKFLLEEEEQQQTTTTRQAKSKALEAITISNNKRRIDTESDINEDQGDNRKRISLSHRSSVHALNTFTEQKHSEKVETTKALKHQRESSSEEEEEEEDDNPLLIPSRPKRNSSSILSYNSRKKHAESTDTGNLCVRRRTGKNK